MRSRDRTAVSSGADVVIELLLLKGILQDTIEDNLETEVEALAKVAAGRRWWCRTREPMKACS